MFGIWNVIEFPAAGAGIPATIKLPVNNLVPFNVGTVISTKVSGNIPLRSEALFVSPPIFITLADTPAGNSKLTLRGSITGVKTPVLTGVPLVSGGAVRVSPVLLGTTIYVALGSRSSNTTLPELGET